MSSRSSIFRLGSILRSKSEQWSTRRHLSTYPSIHHRLLLMPLGLLGKKLGQTSVYNAKGVLTPVTIVLAGPNRVLQCKTQQSDGYNAVQLGFEGQKETRAAKPV